MPPDLLEAAIMLLTAGGGAAVFKFAEALINKRQDTKTELLRLNIDHSGEWSRSLLADQAKFRETLMADVESLRRQINDERHECTERLDRMQRELTEEAKACEERIAELDRKHSEQIKRVASAIRRDALNATDRRHLAEISDAVPPDEPVR